jgi:ComEC/Rec2-related protein
LIYRYKVYFFDKSDLVYILLAYIIHFLAQLRSFLHHSLLFLLGTPHGEVVFGLLCGGSLEISRDERLQIKVLGIQHLMSASGANVALWLGICQPLFSQVPSRRLQCVLKYLALFLYAGLANWSPPVCRASVASALTLLSRDILHKQVAVSRVAITSCILLILIVPEWIRSLSFQLSATASLGIIWFGEPLMLILRKLRTRWFSSAHLKWMEESWAITVAAQLGCLPILFARGLENSLWGLFVNPVFVWLAECLTLLGLVLTFLTALQQFVPFFIITICIKIITTCTWIATEGFFAFMNVSSILPPLILNPRFIQKSRFWVVWLVCFCCLWGLRLVLMSKRRKPLYFYRKVSIWRKNRENDPKKIITMSP